MTIFNQQYIKNVWWLMLIVMLLAINFSCRKLITVDQPTNQLTSELVFNSDQSALSTLSGLYSKISSSASFLNGATTIYAGLASDELQNTTAGPDNEFLNNSISASNSVVRNDFWASGYQYIYTCNAILEGVNKSSEISAATKRILNGETKFIRALCYFYLVNIFGDVPLQTTTSYQDNAFAARSAASLVYQQIISDLVDARSLLSADYPSAERARPNKHAASALLARVYLYNQEYEKAEALASEVLNEGRYSLETNLDNVFLADSEEAIWQLQPNSLIMDVYEGNLFIPNSASIPLYGITNYLLNAFEPGDQRKISWMQFISIGGGEYYYPYKYKIKTGAVLTEYYMVLRLAEQYLIRAEARAQQNNISGAASDINVIRNRAGLSNITANDQSSVLTSIEQERRVEFFAEWGHRWFDLIRTSRADAVLMTVKAPNWQTTDKLFPIPQSQISVNESLIQNPGY
jgi:hypothetical protein